MTQTYLKQMARFDINSLPDLDAVVLAALEGFMKRGVPELDLGSYRRPLVVGSGNAAATGRILFEGTDAVFADEGTYTAKLRAVRGIDGAILISASGRKHAIVIAKDLRKRKIETRLLTCNPAAPAAEHVDADKVFEFEKNREPYTYNTSTYMAMVLGKTNENPGKIRRHILDKVHGRVRGDLACRYDAFYLLVPTRFDTIREMFLTKFDELFGPKISGRVFTPEQTKHAKTVVSSPSELFISFGCRNKVFGDPASRLEIPLPAGAGYGALMAIGYYVIGRLQAQFPPYFKTGVEAYTKNASRVFGQDLRPIVE